MSLDYVPLLRMQRELYDIPRGMDRFREYLRRMIDWNIEDMRLPLFMMNPMAKDHVPAFIDALLALDAEEIAARAVAEVAPQIDNEVGACLVALVVADDVAGGWTNRYASEFTHRFESLLRLHDRDWLIGILWAGDAPSTQIVREEVLTAAYRLAYVRKHGVARTLRERMEQEGTAMAQARCTWPTLDAEDREYSREVIAPLLDTTDMPTAIVCLYGDAAGRTLGFEPRGLSDRAGLALALHDASVRVANG